MSLLVVVLSQRQNSLPHFHPKENLYLHMKTICTILNEDLEGQNQDRIY